MDDWEEGFWAEPENQWVATQEPHCRVCAAMQESDMWLMDIPPRPSIDQLLSQFYTDESYAREANEFGY